MKTDAVSLAFGRLFLLGSRPYQEGDVQQYEMCRKVIMDAADDPIPDYAPNYARDRAKGAQGDK